MKLYYHTISGFLHECLQKLMNSEAFNDFVLVGGTALSLQLGHRMSYDIDLFTEKDYGTVDLERIRRSLEANFSYIERLETLNMTNPGYTLYIGKSREENIKLDLFYTENLIAPVTLQDGIRMASVKDIAAMKLQAIVNSKRKKDFWDIHELLEYFSLEELIQFGIQRNPFTLTGKEILDALSDLTKLTQDNAITCLKGKYWELIIEDLLLEVEQYRNRHSQMHHRYLERP